jgi:pimeloyl-ACP methyl ester carboxylesterase
VAGGSAYLSGISSGAALAFEAALALPGKVKKLAMYEPPYNDDAEGRKAWVQYRKDLTNISTNGKPGDAAGRFMMLVGMPPEQVEGMRQIPMWPMFEAVEATLAYDAAALGDEAAVPVEKAARLKIPALVMNGSATPYPFMAVSAAALAKALPQGQHRTLEGQVHEVEASAIGPVLIEFFTADN